MFSLSEIVEEILHSISRKNDTLGNCEEKLPFSPFEAMEMAKVALCELLDEVIDETKYGLSLHICRDNSAETTIVTIHQGFAITEIQFCDGGKIHGKRKGYVLQKVDAYSLNSAAITKAFKDVHSHKLEVQKNKQELEQLGLKKSKAEQESKNPLRIIQINLLKAHPTVGEDLLAKEDELSIVNISSCENMQPIYRLSINGGTPQELNIQQEVADEMFTVQQSWIKKISENDKRIEELQRWLEATNDLEDLLDKEALRTLAKFRSDLISRAEKIIIEGDKTTIIVKFPIDESFETIPIPLAQIISSTFGLRGEDLPIEVQKALLPILDPPEKKTSAATFHDNSAADSPSTSRANTLESNPLTQVISTEFNQSATQAPAASSATGAHSGEKKGK